MSTARNQNRIVYSDLNRDDILRSAGHPVLAVIEGEPAQSRATLRAWARDQNRGFLDWPNDSTDSGRLLQSVSAAPEIGEELFEALAAYGDLSAPQLRELLCTGGQRERDLCLQRLSLPRDHRAALLQAFVLSGGSLLPQQILPHLPPSVEPLDLLASLAAILPPGLAPVSCFTCRDPEPEVKWLGAQAARLEALIQESPALPVVLCVRTEAWERYLDTAKESRAKALCRQGHIPLIQPESVPAPRQLTGAARARAMLACLTQTLEVRLAEAALDRAERVRRTRRDAPQEQRDIARSAQEAFLYRVLEAYTLTQGRFRLNQPVKVAGERTMEVDLLSETLRIALEVDGYYHFQETAAFRRDRRKDFRLQREGYLVLRVLAEDVVPRLEEVLDLIITAVVYRLGARKGV
jgi:very-short-patch-repair endonuclease